jgi:hypothetical protein
VLPPRLVVFGDGSAARRYSDLAPVGRRKAA